MFSLHVMIIACADIQLTLADLFLYLLVPKVSNSMGGTSGALLEIALRAGASAYKNGHGWVRFAPSKMLSAVNFYAPAEILRLCESRIHQCLPHQVLFSTDTCVPMDLTFSETG